MSEANRKRLTGSVGLAVALILARGAAAQTATAPDPAVASTREVILEQVTVTARKVAEPVQRVPVSITALSEATLEDRQVTSIERLSGLAPNLDIQRAAGPTTAGAVIFIRGIGGYNATPSGPADYPVSLYLDGVLMPRANATLFDLVELQRVEVLRGPQGTLFGRNTTGGAINMVTLDPADDFGFTQKLSYGTYNDMKSRTTIDTGLLGSSGFKARIAYSHQQNDGFVENPLTPDSAAPGARNSDAAIFSLQGALTEKFTLDYRFDYMKQEVVPMALQLAYMGATQQAYFSRSPSLGGAPLVMSPDRLDSVAIQGTRKNPATIIGHALTLNYEVSDALNLKSIFGYRTLKERAAAPNDGQGVLMGTTLTGVAQVSPFWVQDTDQRDEMFTWEGQATGRIGALRYVAGLFYYDDSYESTGRNFFTFVLSPTLGVNTTTQTYFENPAKSYAAFGEFSYRLPAHDKLELTAGWRYTQDEKSALNQSFNFATGTYGAPITGENTWENFSGSLTANYQWTQDVMTYARVASAYRAGGFDRSRVTGETELHTFDPEEALSGEIGLKSDWFDGRVRMNAAVFYTDYQDLQISQFVAGAGGAQSVTVNAGKAEFTGGELEITALLGEHWMLNGSLGYVSPEYKEYRFVVPTGAGTPPAELDLADEAIFPYLSKLNWNAGVQYEFTPQSFGQLSARADYSFRSDQRFFPLTRVNRYNDLIGADDFKNLSARVALTDIPLFTNATLRIEVYGENLLDEDQVLTGVDFGSLNFATLMFNRKRTYGISLTGEF